MIKLNLACIQKTILVLFLIMGVHTHVHAMGSGLYAAIETGEANPQDVSYKESSDSLSLYLGTRLSDNSAIEFGWIDMGEFDHDELTDTYNEVTGFEFSLLGLVPIGESVSLFGKLGLFSWELDSVLFDIDLGSDDGNSFLFGGGLDISFSQNFGGRLSLLQYSDVDDADIITLTFGLYAGF